MKLVDRRTGQLVDVPDADIPALAKTGLYAIPQGGTMPVVLESGAVGTVDAKDASQAFQANARVPTEAEFRAAQQTARAGGLGGAARAASMGYARGAASAMGMPLDPAFVEAVGLLGDSHVEDDPYRGRREVSARDSARDYIRELEGENPLTSQGSELAGLVGATIASGGENAMSKAGGIGESLAPKVLGKIGAGAARGAGEGLVLGAVSTVNEDSLGPPDINAEKVVAGMGHGALMGAGLGAAFSGLHVGGSAARNRVGQWVGKLAPKDVEALAGKQFGYVPEGLGQKVQKAYAKGAAAVAGKDADVVDKFTSGAFDPSSPGYQARHTAVFDAPKIQEAAERDVRTHVDAMQRSGDLVSSEARGQLKAEHVDRDVKKGNEAETRAYANDVLDRIIDGADYQLAHESGVAPTMRKSLETVKELASRVRAVANGEEVIGHVPFIDPDAGLFEFEGRVMRPFEIGAERRPLQLRPDVGVRGEVPTENAFNLRERLAIDPDAGLHAPTPREARAFKMGDLTLDDLFTDAERPVSLTEDISKGEGTKAGPRPVRSQFGIHLDPDAGIDMVPRRVLREIPLKDIEVRDGYNAAKTARIADALDAGTELPPPKLTMREDGKLGIQDGIHRIEQARKRGLETILAEVEEYVPRVGAAEDVPDALRLSSAKKVPREVNVKGSVEATSAPKGDKPIDFRAVKQPTKENGKLYVELDNLKRAAQRISKKGTMSVRNVSDPLDALNADRALGWVKDIASDLRAGLEDEGLWGKQGLNQKTINAAWTKQLDAAERFHRALTTETVRDPNDPYRRLRGADPAKVASYVKNLTNPHNDLTHQAVKDYVASTRELADAIHKSYDLPPEKIAEVERVREAAKGFEHTLGKAEKSLVLANQYRTLTEGTTDSLAALLGTVGGALGGLPGGAVGAMAGSLANPGRTVAQLAAVERLLMKVDTRVASSLRRFMNGSGKGVPPALPEAATPKGFDEHVSRIASSVDADGNITPAGRQAVADAIGDLGEGAPKLAAAVAIKAFQIAQYLAGKVPPAMQNPYEMFPGEQAPLVSDTERETFARIVHAAEDPTSVLEHFARGTVTPEEADVLKTCYPLMFQECRQHLDGLVREAQAKGKPLNYPQVIEYGVLFDVRADATMDPEVLTLVATAQATRAKGGRKGGGGMGARSMPTMRGSANIAARWQTSFEAAASRRKGGMI